MTESKSGSGVRPSRAARAERTVPGQVANIRAIGGLLCAATSSDQAWGGRTAVNLPALTMTVGGMAAALERVAGPEVSALIDWVPDPAVPGCSRPGPARSGRSGRPGSA